jgi:hypothetical protein
MLGSNFSDAFEHLPLDDIPMTWFRVAPTIKNDGFPFENQSGDFLGRFSHGPVPPPVFLHVHPEGFNAADPGVSTAMI